MYKILKNYNIFNKFLHLSYMKAFKKMKYKLHYINNSYYNFTLSIYSHMVAYTSSAIFYFNPGSLF